MSLNGFWAVIDAQLKELESAKSADDVMVILSDHKNPYRDLPNAGIDTLPVVGKAFFAGSGGDKSPMESLFKAGWHVTWSEASYYWEMRAPDGSYITYIEGDILKGKHDG